MQRLTLIGYKATSDLVSKLAFFVVTVMAARALSREEFGAFSLAWTLGWFLGLATDMGLQVHLAREVARSPDRADRICRGLLAPRVTGAIAALIIALCGGLVFLPLDRVPAFGLIVTAQLCGSLIEFFNYYFRGLSRTDVESSLTIAHRLGVLLLAWLLLVNAGALEALSFALFVPAAVTLIFCVQLALNGGRPSGADPIELPRISWVAFRSDVLPIGLGALLSALYFRVDLFLVQHWMGTAAVGLYNAVFRLIEALRLLPAAVLAVIFPHLCRTRDLRLLARTSLSLTLLGIGLAGTVSLAAPTVVTLVYGARYGDAVPAFRVLALALPLLFLNYALTHQLIAWNLQRVYAWGCAAALAFNVVMNAIWIPRFGLEGAAWTTLVTEVALLSVCAVALALRVMAIGPTSASAAAQG